ncbi:hypothetical protein KUV57_13555 [Epibacterium sp. DP7N7-1]|nr:hypothetical protein [Epibacterium sp. DP7N7-1]
MAARKKKTDTVLSPVIAEIVEGMALGDAEIDQILSQLDHMATIRAVAQSDASQDLRIIAALTGLRKRAQLLEGLVQELAAALPADQRSYRALRRRVEEALPQGAPDVPAATQVSPKPRYQPIELSKEEADDFEAWLYMQSNVLHAAAFRVQVEAWRADEEWKSRSDDRPYRSRA